MEESKGNKFVCKFCNKEFPSVHSVRGHMKTHSKKISAMKQQEQHQHDCKNCCKVFFLFKDLCDHACYSGQSDSETSSASESDQERGAALALMKMSRVSNSKKGHNLLVNSLADQFRSTDNDGIILLDSDSSDSDYPINGPKKSDSDIYVEGSLRNRVRNTDELRVKDGGSKHDRSRSKRALPSYENGEHSWETDSLHECPTCFKVFKSGQALSNHKRSHKKQEQRIEHQTSVMRNPIDLNLPASDIDD